MWNPFRRPPVSEPIVSLRDMQRLDVKDGDILVLRSPHRESAGTIERLKECLERTMAEWGYRVHVLILTDSMEIGIVGKAVGVGVPGVVTSEIGDQESEIR